MAARTDILICTDLDRTLLPNGAQPESTEAREVFRKVAARLEVALAYVSGRDEALIRQAIEEYALPVPDFAIGDVGTSFYEIRGDEWLTVDAWHEEIGRGWNGKTCEDLAGMVGEIDDLRRQESEKQNVFKLSYYTPPDGDHEILLDTVRARLSPHGIEASLVFSIDEAADTGLLDVLPANATKDHAVRFLMERFGFDHGRTVYAGDSGNDLQALTGGLQAVLVRNARDDVRREALRLADAAGHGGRLHCATGGFMNMNGNYSAGILEGLAHFIPETAKWMKARTGAG